MNVNDKLDTKRSIGRNNMNVLEKDWDCNTMGHYELLSACCGASADEHAEDFCGACHEFIGIWICTECDKEIES